MILPPTPILETPRLILLPIRESDAPACQRRFARWEVVRHLNAQIPWPYPADGGETFIASQLAKMARGALLCWRITMKGGAGEMIGGIDLWADDGQHKDQRGFWFDPAFQRQGLMFESAERVTAYAFHDLGWPHPWLTNAEANHGSHRIKKKQGAKIVERAMRDYVEGRLMGEIWRLEREDWLARRGGW